MASADIPTSIADGFIGLLDIHVVSASPDEVVVQWTAGPKHHQPMGIVHGGVYCTAIESACSVGASLSARTRDPHTIAVGLENHTSFIRAVRAGVLTTTAVPITRGRTTQVWEGTVRDDKNQVIATGRVRLLVVARDAPLG